jgi:hypothetical protein
MDVRAIVEGNLPGDLAKDLARPRDIGFSPEWAAIRRGTRNTGCAGIKKTT